MKIVFWGSSDFSIPALELLHQTHKVSAIVTNPDSLCGRGMKEIKPTCVKVFGEKHNIKVLTPCNLNDRNFQNELFNIEADIYVVVSYGMIIPENIIYHPKFHTINLHASLLPKYRGPSPIQYALLNGEKITGNTVQFITKELDKGDIILQEEIEIETNETYIELSEKLAKKGALLVLKAIELIETGKVERKKQDETLASYTKIITKEDGKVDFINMEGTEIFNKYRAFKHWPGIFSYYSNSRDITENKEKIYCIFTDIELLKKNSESGKIIMAGKEGLVVACKTDAIKINRIKPQGKKEMDYISFINGYRPVVGNYF